jgi:hypothetical protein
MGHNMTKAIKMICASAIKTTGAALAQLAQNSVFAPVRQSGYILRIYIPRQALTGATQGTGATLARGVPA